MPASRNAVFGRIAATASIMLLVALTASAPVVAQDLITFDKGAIGTLPSTTSPLKITAIPLLQAGGEAVSARISLPANTDIDPHPHPSGKVAIVTVLSGDFRVGLGKTFSEAALRRVAPGEMIIFRDTDPLHFARTGNGPVELLLIAAPRTAVVPALLGAK